MPKGFDYMKSRGTFAEWAKLGLRRADGKPFPASGPASCFFRAAPTGPAFLITENYHVLKEYNNSDAYVIAVGHLADRMNGGAADQDRLAGRRPPAVARRAHRACRKNCPRSATR